MLGAVLEKLKLAVEGECLLDGETKYSLLGLYGMP